jgi:hypothetical protein
MTMISSETGESVDQYRVHVRHLGLSRDAETALLLSVRDIMSNFVNRAFDDDAIQHVQALLPARPKDALAGDDVINSSPIEPTTTTSLADAFTPTVAPGQQKEE